MKNNWDKIYYLNLFIEYILYFIYFLTCNWIYIIGAILFGVFSYCSLYKSYKINKMSNKNGIN